jgi:hypothetical protein
MGQRAGHDVIWKGPATGVTRELALRRLVVQVEDLVMDQVGRCAVEDVLDDFSDSDDEEETGEDGTEGGEGGAGGGEGQGQKRKNGDENIDDGAVQKKHKSNGSDGGEDSAHGVEEIDVAEPDIDDTDDETARGENLAEAEGSTESFGCVGEGDVPEIGAQKKSWLGLW